MAAHHAVLDLVLHATEGLLGASPPGAAHAARGFDHRAAEVGGAQRRAVASASADGKAPRNARPERARNCEDLRCAADRRSEHDAEDGNGGASSRSGHSDGTRHASSAVPADGTGTDGKGTRRNFEDQSVSLSSPLEAENLAKL